MATDSRNFDSSDMATRGRIGGHVRASRYDAEQLTGRARAGLLERFRREVDPDGTLPDHERDRRVEQARSAFYARLARKRWASRRARIAAASAEAGE